MMRQLSHGKGGMLKRIRWPMACNFSFFYLFFKLGAYSVLSVSVYTRLVYFKGSYFLLFDFSSNLYY